jgi:hypothetical protein
MMSTESMMEASQARLSDLQIAEQLVEQAKADGVELVGPGGLLSDLTRTVLETALGGRDERAPGLRQARVVGPQPRQLAQWQPAQDRADRGRAGGDRRSRGTGTARSSRR